MKTQKPLNIESVLATGALTKLRFVTYAGTTAGALGRALGVAQDGGEIGEYVPVVTDGIALVEAGGAISVGAPVASDASGRAIAASNLTATVPGSGTTVTSSSAQPSMTIAGGVLPQGIMGVAMDEATQAGDVIRINLKAR